MAQENILRGYIVKTQDLNEADLLLTFFSQESGKLRFLAKSAKKMASKLRGRLQPNCLLEVTLTSQGSLPLVIGSQVINAYLDIINHQESIQAVMVMQEIILKALPDELPNQELFFNFQNSLDELNNNPGIANTVLISFLYTALHSLGFAPELLNSDNLPSKVFYNVSEGKFKDQYLSAQDQIISPEAYALLLNITKRQPGEMASIAITKELFKVLISFLTYQLERDIKSTDFFLHEA